MTESVIEVIAEHFEPRRYRVRHRTRYLYEGVVDSCYERGFLRPRETPTQEILSNTIDISPEPGLMTDHLDFFGNHSYYVEVLTAHEELSVTKTSILDVHWPLPDVPALDRWTLGSAAAEIAAGDPLLRSTFLLPSDLVGAYPAVAEYARTLVDPEQPFGTGLHTLMRGIYADFSFKRGVTSVRTTLPELLELKAGVCQDFTHLMLGCVRSLGLPARYVSGYIETTPPPGKPKLEGSDASHAWVSVLVPDGTWIDLDPTNDHFADSRYIVTAWGRDFRDVSPLKGVIYTESKKSELKVAVDVVQVDENNQPLVELVPNPDD